MRILIKPRSWINKRLDNDPFFCHKWNFISIFSSGDFSPLPDSENVLKLEFDDITELAPDSEERICRQRLFSNDDAIRIIEFVKKMNKERILVIHCDAGVSRSGAVGFVLNECFNGKSSQDYSLFFKDNRHIIPNPLVQSIMNEALKAIKAIQQEQTECEQPST